MKLNKDTRQELKQGMTLKFLKETYTVLTVLCNGKKTNITVADEYGRHIYLAPSTMFYGAEMIEA